MPNTIFAIADCRFAAIFTDFHHFLSRWFARGAPLPLRQQARRDTLRRHMPPTELKPVYRCRLCDCSRDPPRHIRVAVSSHRRGCHCRLFRLIPSAVSRLAVLANEMR